MSILTVVTILVIVALLSTAAIMSVVILSRTVKDQNLLINSINKRLVYIVVQSTDVLGLFTSQTITDIEGLSQKVQHKVNDMEEIPTPPQPDEIDERYNPFNDKDVT